MIATTITAIARMIPRSCAIFASWRQVDEPDVREGNRERCVSYITFLRLSKKCALDEGTKLVSFFDIHCDGTAKSSHEKQVTVGQCKATTEAREQGKSDQLS